MRVIRIMRSSLSIMHPPISTREVLTYLAVMVGGYAVLTYIVCTWRYARAKKSLKCYYHNLKKLNSLYESQQELEHGHNECLIFAVNQLYPFFHFQ